MANLTSDPKAYLEAFNAALSAVYAAVGSTWPVDIWMLYPYFVISFMGLVSNVFSLVVFCSSQFRISLYKYLRINSICSIVLCLFSMGRAFTVSYHIIPWANSELARTFYVYGYIHVSNIGYFFSSLIEILMLLDRIAYFNKKVELFFQRIKLSPYLLSLMSFVLCFLIYSPNFFIAQPGSISLNIMNQSVTIWYVKSSEFSTTQLAIILKAVALFIKDGLVTVIQVALNLISFYMLKQFLKKKRRLAPIPLGTVNESVSTKGAHTSRVEGTSSSATSATTTSREQSASFMTIALVFLSIVEHAMLIVANVYVYFTYNLTVATLFNFTSFFGSLRRVLDFVIFLVFNRQFRTACLEALRLKL